MAKQPKSLQAADEDTVVAPPVIAPVAVTETDSPKAQPPAIEIPAGHVLIVALNADGTEKAGSEFFYPEKTYKRFYADETKFFVKKKLL